MPKPIKHREFIRRMCAAGFVGPEPGGSHPQMRKDALTLHDSQSASIGDLDWSLVKRIIAQAGISPELWETL